MDGELHQVKEGRQTDKHHMITLGKGLQQSDSKKQKAGRQSEDRALRNGDPPWLQCFGYTHSAHGWW